VTIPNRAWTATASGGFTDIKGNTAGPTVISGWYISETNNSTAGAKLLDGYVAAPGAATTALVATSSGNLTNGAYLYKVTFVTAQGETEAGTASTSRTVDSTHKQIALSAIPTGVANLVTSRNIYRTQSGGSSYTLLATLADNTTTTYTDNVADATISATAAAPSTNTTGFVIGQWDLAAKGAQSGSFDNFESTYPGAPPRLTISSGALRMTLFGR